MISEQLAMVDFQYLGNFIDIVNDGVRNPAGFQMGVGAKRHTD